MRITSNHLRRAIAAAVLSCMAGGASAAAHSYIPFSLTNAAQTQQHGVWLADTQNLGDPPIQLTNQPLDGPPNSNVAILDSWTFNATTHEATAVKPEFVVYGVAGHLYREDLRAIGPVQQFSNGSYGELCSLTALDSVPFAINHAFVQAVVEPVGSTNTCASNLGTQTWLIPANATSATAPTLEPQYWSVLGAFTNPSTGAFVRWIVWTGNEVEADTANFGSDSTLLVGPPAGKAPTLVGRVDGNALLLASTDDGTTHTDTLYHLSMTGSGLVASYSYADAAPCSANGAFGAAGGGSATSSLTDSAGGILLYTEPTGTGYAVYSTPLAGGAATQIYADSSGTACGTIAGDTVSAGHVGLGLLNLSSGNQSAIALNEAGPVSQTPVVLVNDPSAFAFIRYTINGHFWISEFPNASGVQPAIQVMDGDGTPIQTYNNSRIADSVWGGFFPSNQNPSVQRTEVMVFTLGGAACSGASLAAVDPAAFTSVAISNLPADACNVQAPGWQPAAVGALREPAGFSPVEVDPAAGKMYFLLGPDNSGGPFVTLAVLAGFPFY